MNSRMRIVSGIATVLIVLVIGCSKEKKMEPVAVGEMEEYRDPGIGFRIKHPKGWIPNTQVGRAQFYNAQEVSQKFLDPTGAYPTGVEIAIEVMRGVNPQEKMKAYNDELTSSGVVVSPAQQVKAGDVEATKFPYIANYGGKNIINGYRVMVASDSTLYILSFSGFGDYYNAYQATFDASLASFQMPKPVEKGRDETLPSETMTDYDAKMFAFQYPDNFNFTNPPRGKDDIVVGLRGVRLDCNILFNVFGAQGLTLEKVVDQNKGRYKSATEGKATIGGQPAVTLTLSPTKEVERRVYFAVKNDRVVRVTMDWYKPQRAEYSAAYDKVISSIKFK
jgi:hypothetical protein